MRRRGFTLIQAVALLVGLGIVAAVLFPVFDTRGGREGRRSSCQSNLKQIALGIKQYVQDYDEKFPIANSGKQGWMDITMPYLKSMQIFHCPNEASGFVDGTTDYFYNSRLSGVAEASLNYIGSTVMNGDGAGNAPTNANIPKLPKSWTRDNTFPARRHYPADAPNNSGANYSYADGHVKWLQPEKIATKPANSSNTSFAPW